MLAADTEGRWVELCEPDAAGATSAFPLRGHWDSEGRRTSEHGFTLTCASGALGKCVRFGYKPWQSAAGGVAPADYHAACVKAVRADYCGDRGTTRDGQPIDIYDALSIQRRDTTRSTDAYPFEAAFSTAGAVCVGHTRVPAKVTLAALASGCRRLAGRLGRAACREDAAVAGRYGPAMIFIRSPMGERSACAARRRQRKARRRASGSHRRQVSRCPCGPCRRAVRRPAGRARRRLPAPSGCRDPRVRRH